MSFAAEDLTRDAFLGGTLWIEQPREGYRAATDPVLLAAAVPAISGDTVLELGCGAGVASLCLALRCGVRPLGLELQPRYAELAVRNAKANGIEMDVLCGDVAAPPPELLAQSFDQVMFNPPYFAPGDGTGANDAGREAANREVTPLKTWVDTATRRLKPRGRLTVIHRIERLPDLMRAIDSRLGSIRVLPLSASAEQPSKRFILHARKGGRAGFILLPALVTHSGPGGTGFSAETEGILRFGASIKAFC